MSQSSTKTHTLRSPRMAWTPKRIGLAVVLILSFVLILQNWDTVDINLLFWDFSIRLAWVLLIVFILGTLVGWLLPQLLKATNRSRVRVTNESTDA
jgi:uncharacterized integral membrane protein